MCVSAQAHVEIAGAVGRARADPGFHEVLRVLHLDPEIRVGRRMGSTLRTAKNTEPPIQTLSPRAVPLVTAVTLG